MDSLIEIKRQLKPCPFCGHRVDIKRYYHTYNGGIQMTFECFCGAEATFTHNPFGDMSDYHGARERLMPWEQWNERTRGKI